MLLYKNVWERISNITHTYVDAVPRFTRSKFGRRQRATVGRQVKRSDVTGLSVSLIRFFFLLEAITPTSKASARARYFSDDLPRVDRS